jgi:hypothetical protein
MAGTRATSAAEEKISTLRETNRAEGRFFY